jgi:acyl-CoA thioester hydrolase
MSLESRVRVGIRWRDLDMLGHLNQAVYHEFLEEGRASLFQALGGTPFVIARVELDYRHEVRRDHGEVEIVTRVESLGRSSVVLAQEIVLPDGTVAAEGRTVLVLWDAQQRRSRPFSDDERARLEAGLGSGRLVQ